MKALIVRTVTHYVTSSGGLSTDLKQARIFFSRGLAEISAHKISGRVETLTQNLNPE